MTAGVDEHEPMHNGDWHYAEAERLLKVSVTCGDDELAARHIARAQVHATLALADYSDEARTTPRG